MINEELHRVIVEPARMAQLEFDPGLLELLLRDAGNEPGNLPLLQHALLELYTKRQGHRLTNAAYQASGGIRQAIANAAEREFKRCEAEGQGALVRRIFTQLVRLARADEGLEDTRRRIAIAALPPEAKPIIDEFAGYRFRLLVKASERIIQSDQDKASKFPPSSEQVTVEVAHEALIREWSRLKNWLNEDRGFYLWRQQLDQAIKDYDEHDKQTAYLLQGPQLKEAEGKLSSPMPEPLSAQQASFIHTSLDERDRLEREEKAAEEKRLQEKQELEERERNALKQAAEQERNARVAAEKIKRISWIGMVVLFFISAIAYYLFLQADEHRKQVNLQRKTLLSQVLVMKGKEFEAQGLPTKATLLAALALQVETSPTAMSFAVSLLTGKFRSRPLRGHEDKVISVAFNPDGTRIISGSLDTTLRQWDATLLENGKALSSTILCSTLHRNLTREEWKQYVPEGEDFREICKL